MKKILTFILLINSIVIIAQERKIKYANTEYENLAYMDAVKIYERVAEKGHGNQEIYQNLGNAYYFNADYKNASKWYGELFQGDGYSVDSEYYYRYYQVLKSEGNIVKANQYLNKFSKLQPDDSRSLEFAKNKNYMDDLNK